MQTHQLRRASIGQPLNILNKLLIGVYLGPQHILLSVSIVKPFSIDCLLIIVIPQQGNDESSVLIVGHTAPVVALSSQVDEGLEGDLAADHAVQVDSKLAAADTQVAVSEFVGDVPAQWAVFAALLDHCVEEAQAVEQAFEGFGVDARLEEVAVAHRVR